MRSPWLDTSPRHFPPSRSNLRTHHFTLGHQDLYSDLFRTLCPTFLCFALTLACSATHLTSISPLRSFVLPLLVRTFAHLLTPTPFSSYILLHTEAFVGSGLMGGYHSYSELAKLVSTQLRTFRPCSDFPAHFPSLRKSFRTFGALSRAFSEPRNTFLVIWYCFRTLDNVLTLLLISCVYLMF